MMSGRSGRGHGGMPEFSLLLPSRSCQNVSTPTGNNGNIPNNHMGTWMKLLKHWSLIFTEYRMRTETVNSLAFMSACSQPARNWSFKRIFYHLLEKTVVCYWMWSKKEIFLHCRFKFCWICAKEYIKANMDLAGSSLWAERLINIDFPMNAIVLHHT